MSNSHKKAKGGFFGYAITGAVIFFVVLSFGILTSSTRNSAGEESTNKEVSGELSIDETFYDFGSISMAAGKVSKKFSVKNNSVDPVTVRKVYTSCMCTTAYLSVGEKKRGPFGMPGHGGALTTTYQKIAPGEEAEIEIVFDPAAHGPAGVGIISRVVTIEPETGEPLELSFRANVTP